MSPTPLPSPQPSPHPSPHPSPPPSEQLPNAEKISVGKSAPGATLLQIPTPPPHTSYSVSSATSQLALAPAVNRGSRRNVNHHPQHQQQQQQQQQQHVNGYDEYDEDDATCYGRRQRCIRCSKNLCSCMFSHIGLSGLVVAYTILGGFIFCFIEVSNEQQTKLKVQRLRNQTELRFLEFVQSEFNDFNYNDTINNIRQILTDHEKSLLEITFEEGWNGHYDINDLKWSYAGSLLYSVTVITTIGYGHVTPKTVTGRIVTIFYALFGIPLTILYLNNIGDFMADLFQFLYQHMCLPICRKIVAQAKSRKRNMSKVTKGVKVIIPSSAPGELAIPNRTTTTTTERTSNQAQYNYPPSLSPIHTAKDIGLGVPYKDEGAYDSIMIGVLGQSISSEMRHSYTEPLISIMNTKIRDWNDLENLSRKLMKSDETTIDTSLTTTDQLFGDGNQNDDDDDNNNNNVGHSTAKSSAMIPHINRPQLVKTQQLTGSTSQFYHNQMISSREMMSASVSDDELETVPLSLTLTIMVVYIIMGAFLFTMWSETRDVAVLVKWSYFCFITLSTIGFGDIVPGTTIDDENPKEKIIVSLFYVAIGLPVFAMCFKLMEDEIIKKVKALARKIGIIKS